MTTFQVKNIINRSNPRMTQILQLPVDVRAVTVFQEVKLNTLEMNKKIDIFCQETIKKNPMEILELKNTIFVTIHWIGLIADLR